MSFLFCRTINEFVHLKFFRIQLTRVPSDFSATADCTPAENSVTICQGISRSFGQVSVIKSSAYEGLVNEADVSNDQYRF